MEQTMFKDRVTLAKEVRAVKIAHWEGFKRLAKRLPNHHVLAVELLRTRNDETAAVFTVVRNGEPVQTIVMGDANGRVKSDDCGPRQWMMAADTQGLEEHSVELHGLAARSAEASAAADGDGSAPDDFAFGGPPPKQPPEPGIIAVGTVLLAAAFNLAEQVPPSSEK
jgi:hypothetical protein